MAQADEQLEFQREREERRLQRENETTQHGERVVAQFLEHNQRLRGEDRAQQKDLFERLLAHMVTRLQAPAAVPPPVQDLSMLCSVSPLSCSLCSYWTVLVLAGP